MYRHQPASGKASRSSCTTQSGLGLKTALKCRIRRHPCSIDEETIDKAKRPCRRGEEVDGNEGLVIGHKCKPPFLRITAVPKPSEVSDDRTFRYYDPSLNGSPWVFGAPNGHFHVPYGGLRAFSPPLWSTRNEAAIASASKGGKPARCYQ